MTIRIASTPDLSSDVRQPFGTAQPLEFARESEAHTYADGHMRTTGRPAYVYRLHDDGRRQRYWPVATDPPETRIARGDVTPADPVDALGTDDIARLLLARIEQERLNHHVARGVFAIDLIRPESRPLIHALREYLGEDQFPWPLRGAAS